MAIDSFAKQLLGPVRNFMNEHNLNTIYLVTPSPMLTKKTTDLQEPMSDTVTEIFKDAFAEVFSVFTRNDLKEFSASYQGFQELLVDDTYRTSLTEQEICFKSEWFLGDVVSSWSQTVLADRRARQIERDNELEDLLTMPDGLVGKMVPIGEAETMEKPIEPPQGYNAIPGSEQHPNIPGFRYQPAEVAPAVGTDQSQNPPEQVQLTNDNNIGLANQPVQVPLQPAVQPDIAPLSPSVIQPEVNQNSAIVNNLVSNGYQPAVEQQPQQIEQPQVPAIQPLQQQQSIAGAPPLQSEVNQVIPVASETIQQAPIQTENFIPQSARPGSVLPAQNQEILSQQPAAPQIIPQQQEPIAPPAQNQINEDPQSAQSLPFNSQPLQAQSQIDSQQIVQSSGSITYINGPSSVGESLPVQNPPVQQPLAPQGTIAQNPPQAPEIPVQPAVPIINNPIPIQGQPLANPVAPIANMG